jgi:pimeloyl-ACP methyl ester carboxylesterase
MPRPTLTATMADYASFRPRKTLGPSSVRDCPAGDGGAVLVLPGILRGDAQTARFRNCLQMLGYQPFGWELGVNAGPSQRTLIELGNRVSGLAQQHGRIRVVGFSMGGLFARWAAQSRSQSISHVVTICAPFRDPVGSAWLPLRPFLPLWPELDLSGLSFMIRQPPSQPWGALYSKRDGLLAWQSCMDPAFPNRCVDLGTRHTITMREDAAFRHTADFLAEKPATQTRQTAQGTSGLV